jgi:hypothetical protein
MKKMHTILWDSRFPFSGINLPYFAKIVALFLLEQKSLLLRNDRQHTSLPQQQQMIEQYIKPVLPY